MSRAGGRSYYQDDAYAYEDRPRRREYRDVDVDVRESESRRAPPDYLRPDYGRSTNAGPVVIRERKSEADFDRYERESNYGRSRGPPRSSRGQRDDVDIDVREEEYSRRPSRRLPQQAEEDINVEIRERSRQPPPPPLREPEREIYYRRGEGERRPRDRDTEREEITIKTTDDDDSPPPQRQRARSRSRVDINIREQSRGPQQRARSRAPPEEEDDVDINIRERSRGPQRRARSRAPPEEEDDININIREQSRGPQRSARSRAPPEEEEDVDIKYRHQDSERTGHRDTLVVREKSRDRRRSMPPPGRQPSRVEREEFVYRRQPSPPSPPPQQQTEEITIRTRRSSPSPSPSPPRAPSPPPAPPAETRPPIVQEVITHYRNIDHGFERAPRSPSSSPSPPPKQKKREDLEIGIKRKDSRGNVTEEDIRINERDSNSGREKKREQVEERSLARRRSMESAAPVRNKREETNINVNIDADFGNANNERRLIVPSKPKPKELWTEVTKDLVSREAIISMGYRFEETEDYFYVLEQLRYPDVARLVEITEDMRYGVRDRIGQIQWERQDPNLARDSRPIRRGAPPPPSRGPNGWDEITYERDVTYEDRDRRSWHR